MFQIGGGANLDSFSEVININYQKFFGYFFTFQVLLTKCVLNLAIPNYFFLNVLFSPQWSVPQKYYAVHFLLLLLNNSLLYITLPCTYLSEHWTVLNQIDQHFTYMKCLVFDYFGTSCASNVVTESLVHTHLIQSSWSNNWHVYHFKVHFIIRMS